MEVAFRHSRNEVLGTCWVVPESSRCVQCGICSYNCPAGLDVREHARKGLPIQAASCLVCGECVARCPRGVLRFERLSMFSEMTLLRKDN